MLVFFHQHRMRKQKPKHKILDIQYFMFGFLLSQVLLVEKYQQRQKNGPRLDKAVPCLYYMENIEYGKIKRANQINFD